MDDVTVKLTTIFQVVTDWLKFAEAKNAILLAFSGAGITAIVTYLSAASTIPKSLQVGLILTTFLLSLSSLVCSISFLPKTDLEHISWLQANPSRRSRILLRDTDNLYYFGHLQKYKPTELLDSIGKFYFESKIQAPYCKEHLDIASQIVTNSEIAWMKFSIFTTALWLLIVAMLTIPLSLISSLLFHLSL